MIGRLIDYICWRWSEEGRQTRLFNRDRARLFRNATKQTKAGLGDSRGSNELGARLCKLNLTYPKARQAQPLTGKPAMLTQEEWEYCLTTPRHERPQEFPGCPVYTADLFKPETGSIVSATRRSIGYIPSIQDEQPSTQDEHDNQFYRVKPPAGIYISELADQKVSTIRYDSVRKQVAKLLSLIQEKLNNDFYAISNRLPKLHLTEEENGCVLIEWNFEYVRIGFSIESDRNKSFFYIVLSHQDEGIYDSHSRPLWLHIKQYLPRLVNLAIQNS